MNKPSFKILNAIRGLDRLPNFKNPPYKGGDRVDFAPLSQS